MLSSSSSPNELPMFCGNAAVKNVALQGKVHQRRMPHAIARCAVCDKPCQYRYYNVRCCEGCKQFFRRTIADGKHWACQSGDKKCEITENKNKCKSCRLDRCLRVGMDWKTMGIHQSQQAENDYIKMLLVRRRQLTSSNSIMEFGELEFFLQLAGAQVRIKHAFSEFKDNFTGRFCSIVEALQSDFNLLAKAHEFSIEPRRFTDAEETILYAEMGQLSYRHPRANKFFLVEHVICLSLVKLMPAFRKLENKDKALFIQGITAPLYILMNCYCSYEIGAETLQLKDGGNPLVLPYKRNRFANDKQLSKLADDFFTNTMVPFTRTRLSREEYALLLPIFFTQTTAIQGLSEEGKQLLYEESCRCAKMLLRFCQQRMGSPEAGAKRFSECIQLINQCFFAVQSKDKFDTYMETFYVKKGIQPFTSYYSSPMCY